MGLRATREKMTDGKAREHARVGAGERERVKEKEREAEREREREKERERKWERRRETENMGRMHFEPRSLARVGSIFLLRTSGNSCVRHTQKLSIISNRTHILQCLKGIDF